MTNRSIARSLLLLSFILQTSVAMLAGCTSNESGPPALIADKMACKKCNMLLSETRFAAAFRTGAGDAQVFDDIGCMLALLRNMKKTPEQIWVRDYNTDTWIDARAASFVSSQKFSTPMNYGFVAVRDPAVADKLAKTNADKVLAGFDTLMKEFQGIS